MANLKVALPDYDAKTATPEQCAAHSDYPALHIDLSKSPAHFGTYALTWGSNPGVGTTAILTINHNLGYKPIFFVLTRWEDPLSPGDFYTDPLPEGVGGSGYYIAYSTTTQCIIAMYRPVSDTPDLTGDERLFKYYIFSAPVA